MALKRARGQATVELALGLLVFVSVLLAGIHFAEIGFLSLKVTEATEVALFDTTGMQQHKWPGDDSQASTSAGTSATEVQARYQNFDGRLYEAGGPTVTQALTTGTGMTVTCNVGSGPGYSPSPLPGVSFAYSDNGGLSCNSNATVGSIRMTTHFVDGAGGLFHTDQTKLAQDIPVCAIGRASGGGCAGKVTMMLDDWGMHGFPGSKEGYTCPIVPDFPIPCMNTPYWEMMSEVFLLNGAGMGIAGSQLAYFTTQTMPPLPFFFGAENMPWMSAPGMTELFAEPLGGEAGMQIWTTTPGGVTNIMPAGVLYAASFLARDNCFLGRGGC